MKRFLLVFTLLANLVFAFGQKNMLKEFADKEGIATKAVSKSMMALLPIDFVSGNTDMQALLDKVSSTNVYFTPDKEASENLLTFTKNLMQGASYQKMSETETTKKEERVDASLQSYIKKEGDKVTELIVTVKVGETMSSVMQMFLTDFTMTDLKKLEKQK